MPQYVNYFHILGCRPENGSYRYVDQNRIEEQYARNQQFRGSNESQEEIALQDEAREYLQVDTNRETLNVACETHPNEVIANNIRFTIIKQLADIHPIPRYHESAYDDYKRLLKTQLTREEFCLVLEWLRSPYYCLETIWQLKSKERHRFTNFLVNSIASLESKYDLPSVNDSMDRTLISEACQYVLNAQQDDATLPSVRQFLFRVISTDPKLSDATFFPILPTEFTQNLSSEQFVVLLKKLGINDIPVIPDDIFQELKDNRISWVKYIFGPSAIGRLLAQPDSGLLSLIERRVIFFEDIADIDEPLDVLNDIEVISFFDNSPLDLKCFMNIFSSLTPNWTVAQRVSVAYICATCRLQEGERAQLPVSLLNFIFAQPEEQGVSSDAFEYEYEYDEAAARARKNSYRRDLLRQGLDHAAQDPLTEYILDLAYQTPEFWSMVAEGLGTGWLLSRSLVFMFFERIEQQPELARLRPVIFTLLLHSDYKVTPNDMREIPQRIVPNCVASLVEELVNKGQIRIADIAGLTPRQYAKLEQEKGIVLLLKEGIILFSELATLDDRLLDLLDDEARARRLITAINSYQLTRQFFIENCSYELQQALLKNEEITPLIPLLESCDPTTLKILSAKTIVFLSRKDTVTAITTSNTTIAEFLSQIEKFPKRLTDAKKIEYYHHRKEISRRWANSKKVLTAIDQLYSTARDPIGIIDSILGAPAIDKALQDSSFLESCKRAWQQQYPPAKVVVTAVAFMKNTLKDASEAVLAGAKKVMTPDEVQASFDAHVAASFATLHASTNPDKVAMLEFLFKVMPELMEQLSIIPSCSPLTWISYRQDVTVREVYVADKILAAVKAAKTAYDEQATTTKTTSGSSLLSTMCSTSAAVQTATRGQTGQRRAEELVSTIKALGTTTERLTYLHDHLNAYSFLTGPWKEGSLKPHLVKALVNSLGSGELRQAFAKIVFSPSSDEAKPAGMDIFLKLEQAIRDAIEGLTVTLTKAGPSTHR